MSGKVLATDLDGTLFYPKRFRHCICRKNIKFLQDWIDNGNRLVLVTSRSTEFLEKLKKEIQRPFDMISCTSSRIVIDGEVVKDDGIDNVALKTILHDIEEKYHPRSFIMSTRDYPNIIYDNGTINFFFAIIYKLWWIFQFAYREPYIVKNEVFHSEVDRGKVYRILIFFGLARNNNKISKDINKAIRRDYSDIESSWVKIVNEITPANCNKGSGLDFYVNYLNINPKDLYVVGDSGNDISMFQKYYENSYCMVHSYPSVKKYAKHIIARVYNLRKVLKGEYNE